MPSATVGDAAKYMLPEAEVTVATHEGVPLYVEMPTSVFLEVTYTEPGLQGDRSTGGTKPATVETGATIQVPLFITTARRSRSTRATVVTSAVRDACSSDLTAACVRIVRWLMPTRPLDGCSIFVAEGAKTPMPARRKARKRALDVLYEADLRGDDIRTVLAKVLGRIEQPPPGTCPTRCRLVEGVAEHIERIDELIASYAEGWTLDRMPIVDRNLARIAVYELLYVDEIDDAVAITEAVELARQLSTDDSPRFLNGMLGRIAEYTTH